MDRRKFLKLTASTPLLTLPVAVAPNVAWAAAPPAATYGNLLVLIELKGGNDGLNTLVPYANRRITRCVPSLPSRATRSSS